MVWTNERDLFGWSQVSAIYTFKCGKQMKVMSLPPTTPNLFRHTLQVNHAIILDLILWAYYAVMIGEAVDQQSPPHLLFYTVWLGHQRWLSDSSKCKPTNRASGTNSDNACNCIATGKTCSTKFAVVIVSEFYAQFQVVGTFSHKI